MNVCTNLEPKKVFQFFEEICGIPHGSGNTKKISDYCVDFAKSRGLSYEQDANNNVIIKKPGSAGYEDSQPVIIQGHMDMVCEKESSREIDFTREGLSLYIDGDFLKAEGTTLGGDDGIALAYAFALLDSDTLAHPPLEVVLTVDEETGMLGAESIDVSRLKGRRLLNIDSDEEGVFLTSCAGGLRADCVLPVSYETVEGLEVSLRVHGLLGGHSGAEIHKERANGIVTLGRILQDLETQAGIRIMSAAGGLMDNAIPREAEAKLLIAPGQAGRLEELVQEWEETLQKEFQSSDPGISVSVSREGEGSVPVLEKASQERLLVFLRNMPFGVLNRSLEIPDLVETSLNPGIFQLTEAECQVTFSIRSSVTSRKYEVSNRLRTLTEFLGGTMTVYGDYPAWEYKADSKLRELMRECYRDLFKEEPKIQAIHAGLECGLLSGKLPDLDCISFGPNNFDIHTPKERLSISSTARVWDLIVEFLRRAK